MRPPERASITPHSLMKMKNRWIIQTVLAMLIGCALAAGVAWSARAQTPAPASVRYLHTVWTSDDGLPQNSVTSIIQTRDGYLWLGTFGGLVRFDGVKFTVFNTGNAPGLKGNRIRWVYEDRAGGLWIALEYGGLAHYDRGRFYTYTESEGLPDAWIELVQEDAQGRLLLSTLRGIFRFSEGRFYPVPLPPGVPSEATLYHIEKQSGGLWFNISASRSWSPAFFRFHAGTLTTWPINVVFLHETKDGSIWAQIAQQGLDRFKDGAWANQPIKDELSPDKPSEYYMFAGRDDSICLLTQNQLTRVRDGQIISRHGVGRLPDIRSAFEDREGNFWFGGNTSGLHRYKAAQLTAYTAENGLADDGFVPITGDGQGGLWLGGSQLYHYRAGQFTTHPLKVVDRLWSLNQDPDGSIWAGQGELTYFKNGDLTIVHTGLLGTSALALYRDRAGNLWAGQTNQYDKNAGGLARFKDGVWNNYTTKQGLVHNDVRFITEDRTGALWIGTTGGMSRLQDGKFTNYTTAQGLSHDYVREIYEDVDGTLWIGTYGGGLNRFRDGRFTPITTKDGLYDNVVSRILEDDRGNFWMSCNRGIYRASRRELNDFADGKIKTVNCISYGVSDGMKVSECNGGGQPAGWKTEDGLLWFPTIKGVVAVDPRKFNDQPPPLQIEQVLINQRPADLWQPVAAPPGKGELEIHYTALSLTAPEKARFKYRLEGYDQDWVEAGARRVAYYTNLWPGNYNFRVIACNNDGVWNEAGAVFRFSLRPYFYQTRWFYALVGLVAIGLTYLAYRRRLSVLRRAHAAQQDFSSQLIASQEGERQRIAAELHDGLGQRLIVVKNLALLTLQRPGVEEIARQQVEELSTEVTHAIHEVREIAHNLRPHQLDELGLTKALESLLRKTARASAINFVTEIDPIDGLFSPEAEINLYRIVQESLNNIIKHSDATSARIEIRCEPTAVRLTIADNGRGLGNGNGEPGERGFGLIGIAERARMLGGKQTIHSAPGAGTTIHLDIVLQDEPYEK
jgi:signal transduction histidine kinase/ligand-binding sensor domain-containing protein